MPLAKQLLRQGLAFVFIYAALSHYLNPQAWLGFYPSFLQDIAVNNWFIIISSLGELLFGLLILSGRFGYYTALLAAVAFTLIIAFNLSALFIVFRDVGLLFAALALAALEKQNTHQ